MVEWGTKQAGVYQYLGSPKEGTVQDRATEAGKVYEYYAETSLGWGLDLVTSTILGLQTTFTGLEVLYYNVNETTGIVNFQYWYPPTMLNLERQRLGLFPTILAIIAVVIAVIAIFIILDKLGIVKTGASIILDMIPGLIVTVVGGVVMGVLPGKAKIAGVVPLGIGLWLLLQPWLPAPPPPPPCSDYTTEAECVAAGCYWWSDGTCHSIPEGVAQVLITEVEGI